LGQMTLLGEVTLVEQEWFLSKHPSLCKSMGKFLTSIAFGQTHFTSFILCIFSACLIAGSPLVITALNHGNWKDLMTYDDCFTWTTVHPFVEVQLVEVQQSSPHTKPQPSVAIATLQKHHQNFEWQGWQIHHIAMPNAQSKVPILLVHGFGGSVGHWRHNIPVLAQHHSVYAVDLLSFGDSDKPDTAYSLEIWVDQVYEFWHSFIKVPVVLVGNSLGSLTCLAVAAAHPEMVRGVAIISLPDTAAHHNAIPRVIQNIGIQQAFRKRDVPLTLDAAEEWFDEVLRSRLDDLLQAAEKKQALKLENLDRNTVKKFEKTYLASPKFEHLYVDHDLRLVKTQREAKQRPSYTFAVRRRY
jgi:pimeloyl-ACP methyl ester carboxylesterase